MHILSSSCATHFVLSLPSRAFDAIPKSKCCCSNSGPRDGNLNCGLFLATRPSTRENLFSIVSFWSFQSVEQSSHFRALRNFNAGFSRFFGQISEIWHVQCAYRKQNFWIIANFASDLGVFRGFKQFFTQIFCNGPIWFAFLCVFICTIRVYSFY